ncbi:MAG: hypothetical protein HUU08_15760 [Candidatus Brocadia sp.]|nr:hypothetical protein [Candidatus Brocadia sp.]
MMEQLFDQGHYDAVITIAGELLEKGNSYVETCDDEGDSALQISECLESGGRGRKAGWPKVSGNCPDEALKIWCDLAEDQIALTKPSAYETAVGYLKQARDIYRKTHRRKEWESFVAVLREANKKKTRIIQNLRTLTGEKII